MFCLFFDRQVRSLFRMDFDEMVKTWSHFHYDWLPAYETVPKVIGAQLVPQQLESLEVKTFSIDGKTFVYIVDATIITFQFGETLKKMYLAAQTIAVGLEQVILDRAVYGGDYLEQFATTENKLAMVISLKYISNLPKINALLLGTLLFANVVDGETRRAGRRRCPPVDGQQIPRHAQRVRSQFARFHHHEGLHQLARVHPASVASFSKSMNFYLLKCLCV